MPIGRYSLGTSFTNAVAVALLSDGRVCAHAHPSSVADRNGKAKNGKGWDSGVRSEPLKISAAATASSFAAIAPVTLTNRGMTGDALMSANEAAQSPAPAANVGPTAARSTAEPDTINVSPARNTRKPAASCSSRRRR